MFDANNLAIGASFPGLQKNIHDAIRQGFGTFSNDSSAFDLSSFPPLTQDTFTRSSLLDL
jgi:hypothetical protein